MSNIYKKNNTIITIIQMKLKKLMYGALMATVLTGCIDDNYDLSDIDTTSEFRVENLVLPLNLDPVALSDIIRVEEGDNLHEVTINGNTFYAVEKSGEFSSDGIDVAEFTVTPESLYDKTATFRASSSMKMKAKRNANSVSFKLVDPVIEELDYNATDIDGSIRSIDVLYTKPVLLEITVSGVSNATLENLELFFPQGMMVSEVTAGGVSYPVSDYDPSNGNITIPSVDMTNGSATIAVKATGTNLEVIGDGFVYDEQTNSGSCHIATSMGLNNAILNIDGVDPSTETINLNIHFDAQPIHVQSIIGAIQYSLEGTGLNIEPINLQVLPDFLDDDQTDLRLTNPQIYLKLKNPIGKYGLEYQSYLDIIAWRDGVSTNYPSPLVKVEAVTGDYNFVLAPNEVKNIPEEYAEKIKYEKYENLGNILAGKGLPNSLEVKLVDPEIPLKTVTAPFELGQSIEGMEGKYMFLAPLSLAEGSTIVKTVDGWWSEDLADLNIELLSIMADAINGLPTSVQLRVYAINQDGEQISTEGSIKLDETPDNQPIEVSLESLQGETFNNLDGIRLYVMAGSDSTEPLAPTQTITLNNLKAKVTGNYTRKL